MKYKIRPIPAWVFLTILLLMTSGCVFNPAKLLNQDMQRELQKSRMLWNSARDANQGIYRYATTFESWTGYRATTTIVVSDNVVVERYFHSTAFDDKGQLVDESWEETTEAELGTHFEGAPAKTIDELYTACAEEVLAQNPLENSFSLEFQDDGILQRCVYIPNNCADDCESGVHIEEITFMEDTK